MNSTTSLSYRDCAYFGPKMSNIGSTIIITTESISSDQSHKLIEYDSHNYETVISDCVFL